MEILQHWRELNTSKIIGHSKKTLVTNSQNAKNLVRAMIAWNTMTVAIKTQSIKTRSMAIGMQQQ